MAVLRTPKTLVGAELNIPSLSVRSWFEARYGAAAWQRINWIPRRDWMSYLRWYRSIAELNIRNEVAVTGIEPMDRVLAVKTASALGPDTVLARRVVVATGRPNDGTDRHLPAPAGPRNSLTIISLHNAFIGPNGPKNRDETRRAMGSVLCDWVRYWSGKDS
jgi:cation diffusion facilitator CzcD-associated flavoprotein CzcO